MPSAGFDRDIIRAVHGPKIRDIRPDNDEPIEQVLRYVFALIGLNGPAIENLKVMKPVLISFIRRDLGNFGLDEIRVAFHMAIKNELGVDVNHYQNFSPMYLSTIMTAYQRTVRANTIKKFNQIQETEMEKERTMTPEQIQKLDHEFMMDSIIKPWKYYLKSGVITFGILPFSVVYKCLAERLKLIDLTPEQKKDVHKRAIDDVLRSINKPTMDREKHREMMALIDRIERDGIGVAMKNEIVAACHEISVRDFFQQSRLDGLDLESIVMDFIEKEKQSPITTT